MSEWPSPQDLYERYQYAERKLAEAAARQDSILVQFYGGQLSVLGLFIDEDVEYPETEIAVYSPNNRVHETIKVMEVGETWQNIEMAKKYADSYKRQAREGAIHADEDAMVVYRHVTGWQKLEEGKK
jgi:hypothetical protein